MNVGEWAGVVSAVALATVALARTVWLKVLSQRAAKEIAERKLQEDFLRSIVATQNEIAKTMSNELQHISEHMGATVEALRGIQITLVSRPAMGRGKKRKV